MCRCTTHALYRSKLIQQDHCQHLKIQIWIAANNRDVPRVMKIKFPATVMVFGVVSSEGHIMPPHIFEVGLKVNIKVYLDVLKSVVIPWCNQVAGGRPWVWQQDSMPAHKTKRPWLCFRRSVTTLYPSLTGPLLPRSNRTVRNRLILEYLISSSHVASTDFPNSLSLSLSLSLCVHPSLSSCWLTNTDTSKCRGPLEDVNYEFVLTSPAPACLKKQLFNNYTKNVNMNIE